MIDPIKQCQDYLDLFKIDERQYLIGIFQNGITFYKQQIRALNIFHSLLKTGCLSKPTAEENTSICVIGGGIGGLTFAAAAIKSGFRVTIIEARPMYLYMQHACETRKIHPHIYDWPDENFEFLSPYAKTPVLPWVYDTASNVAEQIRKEFSKVNSNAATKCVEIVDARIYRIYEKTENGKDQIKIELKSGKVIKRNDDDGDSASTKEALGKKDYVVDLVVYAPGYGAEIGIDSAYKTPSYWRNDDFAQPTVTADMEAINEYEISGTGDGAFMDLFRIKLQDFDLEDLFRVIKSDQQKYDSLKASLVNVRKEWNNKNIRKDNNWLSQKFEDIKPLLEYIGEGYIEPRLVKNKKVTLIGKEEYFEQCLNLNKVSLLNCLIAYLLFWRLGSSDQSQGFIYRELKQVREHHRAKKTTPVHKIIRHGTDRRKVLEALKISSDVIDRLAESQQRSKLYDDGSSLWKNSELLSHFIHRQKKLRVEYFRTETVSIFSGFLTILSGILNGREAINDKQGMALYRLISVDDRYYYQQMTPYFNNSLLKKQGKVGVIHDIEIGSIGYTFQTGRPYLVKRGNQKSFDQIKSFFRHPEDFDIPRKNSFLTIPVLSKNETGSCSTNLVLFVDSEKEDFFSNEALEVITILFSGFVDSIKNLMSLNQIHMPEMNFLPPPVVTPINTYPNNNIIDLSYNASGFGYHQEQMLFDNFYSFDITYRHPVLFK